jgi:hypothetical protein
VDDILVAKSDVWTNGPLRVLEAIHEYVCYRLITCLTHCLVCDKVRRLGLRLLTLSFFFFFFLLLSFQLICLIVTLDRTRASRRSRSRSARTPSASRSTRSPRIGICPRHHIPQLTPCGSITAMLKSQPVVVDYLMTMLYLAGSTNGLYSRGYNRNGVKLPEEQGGAPRRGLPLWTWSLFSYFSRVSRSPRTCTRLRLWVYNVWAASTTTGTATTHIL